MGRHGLGSGQWVGKGQDNSEQVLEWGVGFRAHACHASPPILAFLPSPHDSLLPFCCVCHSCCVACVLTPSSSTCTLSSHPLLTCCYYLLRHLCVCHTPNSSFTYLMPSPSPLLMYLYIRHLHLHRDKTAARTDLNGPPVSYTSSDLPAAVPCVPFLRDGGRGRTHYFPALSPYRKTVVERTTYDERRWDGRATP